MRNDEGYVVVLSLIMTIVLLTFVSGLTSLINDDIKFVSREENSKKALYLAESGIEFAVSKINDGSYWEPVENEEDIQILTDSDFIKGELYNNNLNLQVKKEDIDSSKIKITSIVTVNNMSKKIVNIYNYNSFSNNAFDYSIASDDSITAHNQAEAYSEYAGDKGDIFATNNVDMGKKFDSDFDSDEEDDVKNGNGEQSLNYLNNNIIQDYVDKKDIEYNGSGSLSSLLTTSDIVYSNTNISLQNEDINGSGIWIIDGDLTIKNNVVINRDSDSKGNSFGQIDISNLSDEFNDDYLVIIVRGKINPNKSGGNNNFFLQGLLYATDEIYFQNHPIVNGSIISAEGKIDFHNHLDISYDDSYFQLLEDNTDQNLETQLQEFNFKLISWSEE